MNWESIFWLGISNVIIIVLNFVFLTKNYSEISILISLVSYMTSIAVIYNVAGVVVAINVLNTNTMAVAIASIIVSAVGVAFTIADAMVVVTVATSAIAAFIVAGEMKK